MLPDRLTPNRSDTNTRSRSFSSDDRAIEGLPIRLVIALVVGVAALALMLNMLGTIGDVGDTEVTVDIDDNDQVIDETSGTTTENIGLEVIDENGNNVDDATVIITAGSAQLDGPADEHTGDNSHEANIDVNPGLRADQDTGTLEVDVVPPSDSNYIDEQPNPEIVVTST